MLSDPKIIGIAILGGVLPSLLWLWFWIREEGDNEEPNSIVSIVFIMGMIGVLCVLPIEKFIQTLISSHNLQIIFWAGSEELIKFLAVAVVLLSTEYLSEPMEWPIYLITAALGFAALENTLYLIKPLGMGINTVSLLTGQLRFLGSTLLHTTASGILGIALGISLHMKWYKKIWHLFVGFILATTLHSVFNFFIIRNGGNDFLKVFAFLWVVTIIVILLFEKVRRMD